MDELKTMRELEADAPPLSPEARQAARARLQREILGAPAVRSRPRKLAFAAVAGVWVVVVAAAVFNAAGVDRLPGWVQPASAAPLLQQAARETRSAPPLAYRDDQFLYTRLIVRESGVRGVGERSFVNEYWTSADGSKPSKVVEHGRTWMEGPYAAGTVWPPRTREEYDALPTDPDELLTAVLRRFGGGSAPMDQESALTGLSLLITRQQAPPALRAAAFEALARVPGVTVEDDVRVGDRRAMAITIPALHHSQEDKRIMLARDTYEHLATRSTSGEFVQLLTVAEEGVVDAIGRRP